MSYKPPSLPRNLRGGEPSEPLAPLPDPARSRPTGRVDGPEPHDALYDGLPSERDDEVGARILSGGDPAELEEAHRQLAAADDPVAGAFFRSQPDEPEWPPEVLELQDELANNVADSLDASGDRSGAAAARQVEPGDQWAEAYEPLQQRASLLQQRRAHSLTRRRPSLICRRRPRRESRPRSRRASRRVSPSRGDPDPAGDTEPPPPAQGRGEDAARNLRALKAAGPVGAAFAAELGHLPGHLQALALSRLDPEFEADFWREIERAAVARWEVVR